MTLNRRTLLTMAAGSVLASAMPAFGRDTALVSGRAFGTSWQVRLHGDDDLDAVVHDIGRIIERIDRAMSPFRPDSEISRFNGAAAGRHAVHSDFAIVASEAMRIAALTDGAFDPSVGPDVNRFGFGPIRGRRTGTYSDFAVSPDAIVKPDRHLTLDLCGIAKGHALDLIAGCIADAGFADFVVELGGEVLARGSDIAGAAWRIGIADPSGGLHGTLDARGLAVATSGDAINAYEVHGRRYSHVIDPDTDEPVHNQVASVTVLAETAMAADALATGLMVMGIDRGIAFADDLGLPVLYQLHDGGGPGEVSNHLYDSHRLG